MTVFLFESEDSYLADWKEKQINGCTYPYRDVILNSEEILPEGALIFAKDKYDDEWLICRFTKCTEEIYATLLDDSESENAWRYCYIPARVITDVSEMLNINSQMFKQLKKKR